jgi:hypothetical protein
MTELAEKIDIEDVELTDATEPEAVEAEEVEAEAEEAEVEAEADEDGETEAEAEDESVVVTIAGETPPQEDDEENDRAPEWVRDLRKQYREEKRRNRELEEKLAAASGGSSEAVQLAEKPTLEKADYDTDRYEQELAAWYEQKRKYDEAEAAKQAEQQAVEQEWKQKLEGYQSAKSDLKVRDFEDAEDTVQETLSVTQQGMILQGAENPALLVYALGKNPKKAKELASIQDPVKFAFAVAKLETNLKVTKRKASSKPEKALSGTARPSGSVDSTLERLRAEAERTGDYSKVFAYKRQKRS